MAAGVDPYGRGLAALHKVTPAMEAALVEGVEEVRVEDLFAEAPVEPFDEGVLIRLPGALDQPSLDSPDPESALTRRALHGLALTGRPAVAKLLGWCPT